jgi:hypothetical protein
VNRIIVDIDNTLWDFATVLYQRMNATNPSVPPPQDWHVFDFFKAYISTRTFLRIIKTIHADQDQFLPFRDAQSFLASLRSLGFHIVIASHREKETRGVTVRWLTRNNLVFDELHLSNDKTVLFDDCVAVIDDSPFVLQKAADAGIIATGLKMAWNEDEGYTLFNDLTEILQYLKAQRHLFSPAG